jgi:hypothetical protein
MNLSLFGACWKFIDSIDSIFVVRVIVKIIKVYASEGVLLTFCNLTKLCWNYLISYIKYIIQNELKDN